MTNDRRLIEVAFPLKQASLDSVHEKNVRHGHISTLHIWPARRPPAACRAALIATLLPDPGDPEKRQELLDRLGGKVVEVRKKKRMPNGKVEEVTVEETIGGILHWGRESGPDLEWFRQEIRKAYGGRAPRVLDPFAGGGAIPLEAMRLGCEATAVDINPVAWFILKCTLEYPQKLAGQTRPLPSFVLRDRAFMESFFKAQGLKGKALKGRLEELGLGDGQEPTLPDMAPPVSLEANLAWHVRAWGWWVLQRAKADLAPYYPVVDGKPTVAYLWARTVTCKACRATVPLLKTRWLCKKDNKRVLLTMEVVKPHPQPPLHRVERGPGGEVLPPRPIAEVPGYIYQLCREARANLTPAEQILWEVLRDRRLGGWKFRRQHPLGRYIADFYCADARLAIELDGPIHDRVDQKDYDRVRQEELQARGIRVLRLTNGQVEQSLETAVSLILQDLASLGQPPSPRSGEGAGGEVPHVVFGIQNEVPVVGSNAAQRREYDRRLGAGTMSRSGVTCPCCGAIVTMEDLRLQGQAGRLDAQMTAVVIQGSEGKEYRLPLAVDDPAAVRQALTQVFAELPFGIPDEPLAGKEALGFRVPLYGLTTWCSLFRERQLLALGTFVRSTRLLTGAMRSLGYPDPWVEAVIAYLALVIDRLADAGSTIAHWQNGGEFNVNTFQRFALPMSWDYAEVSPISTLTGGYPGALEWVALVCERLDSAIASSAEPRVMCKSAIQASDSIGQFDLVLTDPPYYDAIPYSDLMDFFYVWLKRSLAGLTNEIDLGFRGRVGPKWDSEANDGELIDDSSRHGGDPARSKAAYEDGMARVFQSCHKTLTANGRLAIVFAHKHPDAWETLVSAIIRAGFVVDGSWPLQTERAARTRSLSSAALSSSVWLVCKKRPATARPGWGNVVLEEMRANIKESLHRFWDAGIRGPDFVWAATGPALEAYSKYPVVKKADAPNERLSVSEFLRHVRRIVVDFAVGRVLSHNGGEGASGLDDVTTYYLLHRSYFKLDDAPSGACILYAVSCGLSDVALADQYDLLVRTGGREASEVEVEAEGDGAEAEDEEGSGSKVRLKAWQQRKRPSMGYETASGRPVPLIDQAHRLMHLWKAGKTADVNEYVDERGLRRHALFGQLLQALIELAPPGSEERALLESISNHLAGTPAAMGRLF